MENHVNSVDLARVFLMCAFNMQQALSEEAAVQLAINWLKVHPREITTKQAQEIGMQGSTGFLGVDSFRFNLVTFTAWMREYKSKPANNTFKKKTYFELQ